MKALKIFKDFFIMTIGALIIALALNVFIANHNFAFGGVSGLAVIIYELVKIPLSVTNFIVNIPLFLIGAKLKGKNFLFKSIVATIEVSIFLFLTDGLQVIHSDNIIAAIFGGILMGTGVGIVISSGGSTGGTDLAALILNKVFKAPLSISIFFIDSSVILIGTSLFGFNNALYSLIVVVCLAKSVKYVTQNFDTILNKISDKFYLLKKYKNSRSLSNTQLQHTGFIIFMKKIANKLKIICLCMTVIFICVIL